MVQKWTDESEMQEENNSKKSNQRFHYQSSKQKSNPWGIEETQNSNDEYGFSESSNKFSSLGTHATKINASNSNFDLESVWSVKRNVPLPSNQKKPANQLNLQPANSYYSRHTGGLSGGFQAKPAASQKDSSDILGNGSSWNMKRQGYSYDRGSVKRQASVDDDDDEFDFTEPKKKNTSSKDSFSHSPLSNSSVSKSGSLASMVNPQRKASARTLRAQKMNDAYLRSAGLGEYSSPNRGFNSP
eukprot:gene367-1000_t